MNTVHVALGERSYDVRIGPGLIALAVLLTFVLADVAYRRVEAPFMRMAPKLGARMKAPRATGARLDRETLRP